MNAERRGRWMDWKLKRRTSQICNILPIAQLIQHLLHIKPVKDGGKYLADGGSTQIGSVA